MLLLTLRVPLTLCTLKHLCFVSSGACETVCLECLESAGFFFLEFLTALKIRIQSCLLQSLPNIKNDVGSLNIPWGMGVRGHVREAVACCRPHQQQKTAYTHLSQKAQPALERTEVVAV